MYVQMRYVEQYVSVVSPLKKDMRAHTCITHVAREICKYAREINKIVAQTQSDCNTVLETRVRSYYLCWNDIHF